MLHCYTPLLLGLLHLTLQTKTTTKAVLDKSANQTVALKPVQGINDIQMLKLVPDTLSLTDFTSEN